MSEDDACPLCGRPLGTLRISEHHLVPRRYKGRETRRLHAICHRKIHATFTDKELRDKPPEFYAPTRKSHRRS